MSEMEITKLYESLFIAEEDRAILEMSEETSVDGVEDVDRCLVVKVLSGKKVNREAFKGLIEQIWNPNGQVEVELVGDNRFMFYFINNEDRNRVWNRGPWHFGNSLIVLEKPVGPGNISKLSFNKADFWVQIHDIPILCMNRRTAKWLAEQIGEVVEIPLESRECWGKFMRVKVRIDILKPLKRWLRLKLGKCDEITTVGLKYERLPEFCYACGKIGHGIKECFDEEARQYALEGSPTRFGSWLKAPVTERVKPRFGSIGNGSSSDRVKSSENSHDTEGDGSVSLKSGFVINQQKTVDNPVAAGWKKKEGKQQETLPSVRGMGSPQIEDMSLDGPGHGQYGPIRDQAP
ncbi:hypothetical protein EZV62_018426 [Acer yangbiense]|uniref:CCHC-type domain-containing protein n=1 Tax=Acer yangbiense TaxID=1000413 RepID=A0A5C7HJ97_9ROSI|nr:hypothetical protein EZV62_018426 [Acer yangbiense]